MSKENKKALAEPTAEELEKYIGENLPFELWLAYEKEVENGTAIKPNLEVIKERYGIENDNAGMLSCYTAFCAGVKSAVELLIDNNPAHKEISLEDLEHSDIFLPIFSAFVEIDAANYLAQEMATYFEDNAVGKDDSLILYQFDRYRALMWALHKAIIAAQKELSDIGISRR